jgi:hypothetical protein
MRVLAAFVEPLSEKLPNRVECDAGRAVLSDSRDKAVRHFHPNIQPGIGTSSRGAFYIAVRVIEQHFVVSHMNSNW